MQTWRVTEEEMPPVHFQAGHVLEKDCNSFCPCKKYTGKSLEED